MLTNTVAKFTTKSHLARGFATHTKVAIVGGGPSGNSVSSQLINSGFFQPEDITVFDKNTVHHYQPGYTNVGGGVWSAKRAAKDLMRNRDILLNPGLNYIREHVASFDPENNSVTTQEGNETTYDYLVVASGYELRYDLIPGAAEALKDPECPAGSLY